MKFTCDKCGGEAVQGFSYGVLYCLKDCHLQSKIDWTFKAAWMWLADNYQKMSHIKYHYRDDQQSCG